MGLLKNIIRNPQRINRSMEFPEDVMMRAPTDQAPFNVLDYGQLAAPVFNFAKSVAIGPSEPFVSDTMKDQLIQKAMDTGLDKGTLGYEDFGLPVSTKGGRFTGGLFDLALNDPVSFANVGSVGRVSFEKDPTAPGGYRFGDTIYDFSVDKDTGSTDNAFLDFINRGGIKSAIGDFFFAPAFAPEVTDEERKSIERQSPSFRSLSNPKDYEEPERDSLLSRILELGKGLGGGIVDAAKGAGNVLSNLGIVGALRNFDNFKNLSPIDQQFILSQAGGNRPMKDKYGYNIRSARGNYAQLVKDRAKLADFRKSIGKPLRAIDKYYLNKEKERQKQLQQQIEQSISEGRSMQRGYEDTYSSMGYSSPAERAADTPTGTLGRV